MQHIKNSRKNTHTSCTCMIVWPPHSHRRTSTRKRWVIWLEWYLKDSPVHPVLVLGTQPGFGEQLNGFALHFRDTAAMSPAHLHTHCETWLQRAGANTCYSKRISFGPLLSCSKRFETNAREENRWCSFSSGLSFSECEIPRRAGGRWLWGIAQGQMVFPSQPQQINKSSDLNCQPAKLCSPGDPHLPFAVETGSSECNLQKCLSPSASSSVMRTFCFAKAA